MYDELIIVIRYNKVCLFPLQGFLEKKKKFRTVTFLYMLSKAQQQQASFSCNDPSASDGAHGFDGYQKEHRFNLI